MKIKEEFHSVFFSVLGSFFLSKKTFGKNFSFFCKGINQIIVKNGFFAGNFFLNPDKMSLIIQFIRFFFDSSIRKIWGKKELEKKKKKIAKTYQKNQKNIFFPKTFSLNPKQNGQLIFMEGIVTQISPRMTKKIEKRKILFPSNFPIKRSFSQKDNVKFKKKEKLKTLKNFSNIQVDYQEIQLFSFGKDLKVLRNFDSFLTKICFTNNLGKIYKTGQKVSLWGVVKSRIVSHSNFGPKNTVDFFIQSFRLKIKKKKIGRKSLDIQNRKLVDFFMQCQDSKIRGGCLFKRNYTLSHLFPGNKYPFFFKLLVLLCFLGGFSKNFSPVEKKTSNLCIIGEVGWKNIEILKQVKKFWRNSLFIPNSFSQDSFFLKNKIEIFTKESFQLGLVSNFLSEKRVIFLENIENPFKMEKNFTFRNSEPVFSRNLKNSSPNFLFSDPIILASTKIEQVLKFSQKKEDLTSYTFGDSFFVSKDQKFPLQTYFDAVFFFTKKDLSILKSSQIASGSKNLRGRTTPLFLDNGFRNWSSCNFKKYFGFIKLFGKPKFSREAEKFLLFWYKEESLKKTLKGGEVSILEKLIRLSEAHARLLLQDFVLLNDCILAFFIIYYSFVSDNFFDPSNDYFSLSNVSLNIFPSFRSFYPFFFLKNFKIFGGIRGLSGGTLKMF